MSINHQVIRLIYIIIIYFEKNIQSKRNNFSLILYFILKLKELYNYV